MAEGEKKTREEALAELREARSDQPLISSGEKRQQREEILSHSMKKCREKSLHSKTVPASATSS